MSRSALSLGYSPCPNDTFIFHGLVHGLVPLKNIAFSKPVLEDVETLNMWALEGRLDVTKLSFHALGHVLDKYMLLRAGSALGRGCGPLLITGPGDKSADVSSWSVAVPGAYTTAAMLLRLYDWRFQQIRIMRFEQIMKSVLDGEVDAGVIIHESRFTYQQLGLKSVVDLGEWWEQTTGLPIPLGCIAARRSLPDQVVEEVDTAIRESLRLSYAKPSACSGYIKQHSQELEDEVIRNHIDLYVNDFSIDLGEEGLAAVMELLRRGVAAGLFPGSACDNLRVMQA